MTNEPAVQSVTLERSYDAPLEHVWELWTTKRGFESWWGPEGFRVEVHTLDLRVGGELRYDMIAATPEAVEAMKAAGMGTSQETRGTFVEIEAMRRLKLRHMIDFLPGIDPYEHDLAVDLVPEGDSVRMIVTIEPHSDAEWTQRAAEGFESQLTKVPALLRARKSQA